MLPFHAILQVDIDLFVPINIDHPRLMIQRFPDRPGVIDMDMTVEVESGTKGFQNPAKGFNPSMRQVILIVDIPGRSMGHENIQVTPDI